MSTDTAHHVNPHHEHPDVVGSRNRLGVILLIVADVAFALSMVFTYFYLKAQNSNDMWLPGGNEEHAAIEPVSSSGAWTVTAIAAAGLLFHYLALRSARQKKSGITGLSFVALAMSIAALVMQIAQFGSVPFTFTDGAYVSCWYMFAILNTVHIILTAFIALGNWNRSRLGLYKSDSWHVEIVNIWWIWMVLSSGLGAFSLSFA